MEKVRKVVKFSNDTPSSEPLDRRNENSFSDYSTVFDTFSSTAEQN
jgi:hypothetical protein